jgi:RNA polymerase-binding transcription factor DksA
MCDGFDCGDGWYDLIHDLSQRLEEYNDIHKEEDWVVAIQVKQKMGGLRFYIASAPNHILDLISETENKSEKICEECGKPGEVQELKYKWLTVLCDDCNDKYNKGNGMKEARLHHSQQRHVNLADVCLDCMDFIKNLKIKCENCPMQN